MKAREEIRRLVAALEDPVRAAAYAPVLIDQMAGRCRVALAEEVSYRDAAEEWAAVGPIAAHYRREADRQHEIAAAAAGLQKALTQCHGDPAALAVALRLIVEGFTGTGTDLRVVVDAILAHDAG